MTTEGMTNLRDTYLPRTVRIYIAKGRKETAMKKYNEDGIDRECFSGRTMGDTLHKTLLGQSD